MAAAAKLFLGIWMAGVVAATYLYLPPAQMFPQPGAARIVALHLPNAVVSIVAAFAAAFWGARYLRRRDPLDDARSKIAAALAALFCLLTTITGMIFARVEWGAYWNWDPKQTCIFVLLLIYAAYFLLRATIEDENKRGAIAAVYMLFAAGMTPLLGYVVPKYLPSLHPTNTVFDARYHTVIWSATAGLIGVYAWLQNLAVRCERVRLALAAADEEGETLSWNR